AGCAADRDVAAAWRPDSLPLPGLRAAAFSGVALRAPVAVVFAVDAFPDVFAVDAFPDVFAAVFALVPDGADRFAAASAFAGVVAGRSGAIGSTTCDARELPGTSVS